MFVEAAPHFTTQPYTLSVLFAFLQALNLGFNVLLSQLSLGAHPPHSHRRSIPREEDDQAGNLRRTNKVAISVKIAGFSP